MKTMSANKSGAESCVETPAAPEWLSKLESRREKLTKLKKLGHESGAGAPCNACGTACPGLDLHFWRKVCRNCKCRKDQHLCDDSELSGWAQFEILGQIRSKPAFMKIKALADQPVKLEWIPPNATPDVVSEYMDKLGSGHIPVAGSDAANKRKQQLEFQVPPHDLDAALCDNLTDAETAQLQQYVQKVREHCVGQGNVVRVGVISHAVVGNVPDTASEVNDLMEGIEYPPAEILTRLRATPSQIIEDRVIKAVLSSQSLVNAMLTEQPQQRPNKLVAFDRAVSPDFNNAPLDPLNKQMLRAMHLNTPMVISLVENGPLHDLILNELKYKNVDFSNDPVLVPMKKFRQEYLTNEKFKNDMDKMVEDIKFMSPTPYVTPSKTKQSDQDSFHSPLPIRNPVPTRVSSLMKQDTPMRKVKFGGVSIAYDLGVPVDSSVERDTFFASIVNSETLQNVLKNSASVVKGQVIALSNISMVPDLDFPQKLSLPVRRKLERIGVKQQAVQSAVINGPMYDKLLAALRDRGIDFKNCRILAPIEEFREEFLENLPFQKEISEYVETLPNSISICYSEPIQMGSSNDGMSASKSSDSGFESKPSTPNNNSNLANITTGSNDDLTLLGMGANAGKWSMVPEIEDMNMYPQVKPSQCAHLMDNLPKDLHNMQLNSLHAVESSASVLPVAVLKCCECQKDIMSGEVAVKAERAGREAAWHPQCFVCHTCHELLADLVYFFHGGNVYCGRDLAVILQIPRCNACDELIFTKEYTAAEGATFHIKHFCCYQCDTPLAGQQYVPDEKTNMPLCLRCYDVYFAERCQFCKYVIGPSEQGVAWGKVHWHGECFMCAGIGCGKSLLGGRFCIKNDMPFCSPQCVKSVILS